jgi:16S rRNA (guanine527-N7)-methyltransferase
MPDPRARLDQLVAEWRLPAVAGERFWTLLELIASDPHAPTAVPDPAEGVDAHVADSLVAMGLGLPRDGDLVVDIGSGAGLPGLVLAIARPAARYDLLEASRRKAAFIRHAAAALGLDNVRALHARAEEWGAGDMRERYEVALARAVASLPTLVEYAAPLLATGGSLVVWRGRRDPDEERRAATAAELLGMTPTRVERAAPFEGARDRHLHVFRKDESSPAGYPRRPGMARKRPLGGSGSGNVRK